MVKKGWKGIYADLKTEFIVAREYVRGKIVYERIHWSKIETRDLSNLISVYDPDEYTRLDSSLLSDHPQSKKVATLLRKIPDMREYISENSSNRMRDMGLIEYHVRKRLERLLK